MLEEDRLVKKRLYKERMEDLAGRRVCVLRRKYELDSKHGPVHSCKGKIKTRNEKKWVEEVRSMSILKWYKLAKNGAGWRGI